LVGLPSVFHSGKLLDQSTQNMAKQNSGGKNPTPYTNLGGAKKTKNPNQKKKTKAKQKNQNIRTYAAMGRTDGGPTDLAAQIP
jgi:hypothetical protein